MSFPRHCLAPLGRDKPRWNKLLVATASVITILLGPGMSVHAQDYWIGEGSDNLWTNPSNWGLEEVPQFGEIRVNGPEAEGTKGPLIEEGMEAIAGVLIADAGSPTMTMTGGRLELNGWGTWWSDAPGTVATFNMSGGVIEFTGNPGIMELGWQDSGDPIGSSVGIWNITGGAIYAQGVDAPGKNNGGIGIINLWGGTLNVGTSRGGLVLYEGAHIDISEGVLVLEGDQTAPVEDYIGSEWITAYGGEGDLIIDFDGDYTTVVAQSNSLPGDFDRNGVLDANDIDLLSAQIRAMTNDADFDLNDDLVVDRQDHIVWVKQLKNTWYGDADLDGEFNSADFVRVFQLGEYEDGVAQNSNWGSGDWNADAEFDSGDFVDAFQDGGFELGPAPAVKIVPEPQGLTTLLVICGWRARRRRSSG